MVAPTNLYTCPHCGHNAGIRQTRNRDKSGIERKVRDCHHCQRSFWTYDQGEGERFDCWVVPGDNRNTYEWQKRRLVFLQYQKRALSYQGRGHRAVKIAFVHIRQRLGIPTPLKAGKKQD